MQVTGFSVGGRIVDGNNIGVDGVKIIVDGQEKSITDKEGYYKLDQVKLFHGTYITRVLHHICFNLLSKLVYPASKSCYSHLHAKLSWSFTFLCTFNR